MIPKVREWIISVWFKVLDYDTKKSKQKQRVVEKERSRSRLRRLQRDSERAEEIRLKSHIKTQRREELAAYEAKLPPNGLICSTCGILNSSERKIPGSFLIEIVLWVFFCLPGLIYSLWRITSAKQVCKGCGGNPIPVRSPLGNELWARYYQR